ncbi:gp58-like family protein, partial [Limosilactobacillus reuteri]|nr:gp58-like family protein [Limosilactobacillus reuteri]
YYTKSETDSKADFAKNDAVNAIKSDGNWQGLNNILTNSGFLQTADGFLQKVQQTTIPMFNGGGVNLVKDTSESEISGKAYDIKDYYFSEPLEPNTKYTISIDAKVDQEALNHQQFIFVDPYTADWSWGAQMSCISASLEYQHYRYTFITPDASQKVTNISVYLAHPDGATNGDRDNLSGTGYFKKLKVERGEIDTPYSHAPSDNASQIAFSELSQSLEGLRSTVGSNYGNLQSQINQSSSAVRTEFIDKLNGVQNQITTTANGLDAKISAIQVGGRNLLIGTSEDELSGKSYNFADYQISGGLQPNKTYTLSGWARVDQDSLNHKQWVMVFVYAEDWSWSVNLNIDASLVSRYNKLTFTTPDGKQLHPYVTVYLAHPDGGTNENNNDAISGMAFIKKLKLEEGNIATDYTHAPEDTEKSFTEVNAAINGLRSTVSNNYGQLQSLNTQTATAIRNEVTDKVNGLQGQITTQANNINLMLGTAGDLSNICRNPTFDNHDGWTDSVHVESNWPEIPTKNCGVLFTRDGYYGKEFTVVPGDRYYTSVFANNQNDVDFVLGLHFKMKDGSDQWLGGSWIGAWECRQALGSITVPDNAVAANIWASIQKFDNFGFTRFTNVIVKKNDTLAQINMSAGATLIQNDKIYMDSSSTIFSGKAFIPDAAITNISADKITAGTLDAGRINVVNLNANNITTGTINGQNLKIDLNTGNVEFQHGRIHNFSNTVDINLDQNYISTANYTTRALLKDGELQLTQPNLFDTNGNWYFRLFNGGGAGDAWAGASLIGRDSVIVANEANAQGATGFTSSPMGTATFSGLFTGKGTNNWMPTILGGAERGVFIKGGNQMSIKQNVMDPNDGGVFVTGSPFISVGVDGPNNNWWGNRIVIDGEYLHVPTAWRHTTGGAPNLVVASDGALVRSTSASKYKTEIHRDYSTNFGDRLLELPTATWIDKGQKERYQEGKRHIKPNKYFGMIAEDLADAGLDLFVSRNPQTHEIEGIQYERIAPALIPVIRKLKKKVQELEEKLNEQ